MNLFKAHEQWANRPDDERFNTLEELAIATKAYANTSLEKFVDLREVRADVIGRDVVIVRKQGIPANLTNWSFGQLAVKVGAPASYLRKLPATLAVQNINHGLKRRELEGENENGQLLIHRPESDGLVLCRAITTDRYERIWNYEVADRLVTLQNIGWEPAVPDFNQFDDKKPIYASDHDMFVFLRNKDKVIAEVGSTEPVWRGVIVENSEVGASALKMTKFLYRKMCGNHIIWGTSKVMDMSIRHIGDARQKWGKCVAIARSWADESASEDEAKIIQAKRVVLGFTKEEVLDTIFGKRQIKLSRKQLEAGYDAHVEGQDGDPNSVWGVVQGLTRYSQTIPYADQRTEVDRGAGRILEAAASF